MKFGVRNPAFDGDMVGWPSDDFEADEADESDEEEGETDDDTLS